MPLADVGTPTGWLYRLSRAPAPLAWPDRRRSGANRFDLPGLPTRVLYAATQRRAAFVETLARLRPGLEDLATAAPIPSAWFPARAMARFHLMSTRARWLDLRSPATLQALRGELAGLLLDLGLTDFDLGDALSRDRRLTQAIARLAYDHGHGGIRYPSRFDPTFELWAIFEGATFVDIEVAPIALDDPDLLAVARLFRLSIEHGPA